MAEGEVSCNCSADGGDMNLAGAMGRPATMQSAAAPNTARVSTRPPPEGPRLQSTRPISPLLASSGATARLGAAQSFLLAGNRVEDV